MALPSGPRASFLGGSRSREKGVQLSDNGICKGLPQAHRASWEHLFPAPGDVTVRSGPEEHLHHEHYSQGCPPRASSDPSICPQPTAGSPAALRRCCPGLTCPPTLSRGAQLQRRGCTDSSDGSLDPTFHVLI